MLQPNRYRLNIEKANLKREKNDLKEFKQFRRPQVREYEAAGFYDDVDEYPRSEFRADVAEDRSGIRSKRKDVRNERKKFKEAKKAYRKQKKN